MTRHVHTSRLPMAASAILCMCLCLVGTASSVPAFPTDGTRDPSAPMASPHATGATSRDGYADTAGWQGSLPSEGEARILALRVSFPMGETEGAGPLSHGEGDTLEALRSAVGGDDADGTNPDGGEAFPYESAGRYYGRSSYGQLHVTGDAYDYEARLPRDRYEGHLTSLFCEALAALDPQVDYADYDGDGDGTIDCVCMRPAGTATEQDSDWWSHAFHATPAVTLPWGGVTPLPSFDGKMTDSLVVLHRSVGTEEGVRTLLHEMGHAMGLPDYYTKLQSDAPSNGSSLGLSGSVDDADGVTPGGIRTHDMMNDNMGDHNGYSKWMLGWVPDDRVIRVTCDSDGRAVAMLGDRLLSANGEGGDGHATLELGTLAGDGEAGDPLVIAVYPEGDDGSMGPLSDFYLLQYVSYTGNQQVYGSWGQSDVSSVFGVDLSCGGFQMFRVQGRLADDGARLAHGNTDDPRYDQLIEVVNPSERRDGTRGAFVRSSWGCQDGVVETNPYLTLMANATFDGVMCDGKEVTPDTFPSTNFHEDPATGRTGICVRVVQTEGLQGVVEIWYE